jgi:hypothetical protein
MVYGALSPHQILALLEHGPRDRALAYLARCTRLAAALEAFLPPAAGDDAWLGEGDALARRLAALVTRLTEERDQARAGLLAREEGA